MSTTPPRFVPTLTEVVTAPSQTPQTVESPSPSGLGSGSGFAVPEGWSERTMADLETRLVVGVMQRVDLLLERRIREAVGQVISEHSEGLAQRLREDIEQVVQDVVGQAVDVELAALSGRSPGL